MDTERALLVCLFGEVTKISSTENSSNMSIFRNLTLVFGKGLGHYDKFCCLKILFCGLGVVAYTCTLGG